MSAADGEKLVEELGALLAEMVSLARAGQMKRVSSSAARLEELLARSAACKTLPHDGQKARDLRRLHNELCLTLAAKKSELAGRLRRLNTAKRSIRAYHSGAAGR